MAHTQLNTMYQYWFHTDLVKRMPFGLEYVLNTPSHHRMHHRPPGNCNYAGVLIIWDRMFGTFVPETIRRDYFGLAEQPQTFDMMKLNVNHIRRMADINREDGGKRQGGWLRNILKRRVHARYIWEPLALFKPIPPIRVDERDSKVGFYRCVMYPAMHAPESTK